jgi:hypothetical protein
MNARAVNGEHREREDNPFAQLFYSPQIAYGIKKGLDHKFSPFWILDFGFWIAEPGRSGNPKSKI